MPVVADGDPVRLGGSPLNLVYLPLGGRVGQDRVLYSARHLLDVPDQGLVVVTRRADVARTVETSICYFVKEMVIEKWPRVCQLNGNHKSKLCIRYVCMYVCSR